ncbi:MAG: hypothetical protein U9Q30_08205 [Campylobacterota bacterium]|nr:hypothetical protein [Campylobacterota bacterium]
MKTSINKFKIFIIVDFIVIASTILFNQFDWLVNTQVAFFSSLAITLGSFYGYKKNIENRVKDYPIEYEEIDEDDKYDLYSDEVYNKEIKEDSITKEQIKEAMKPIKQNYFKNFTSGIGAMTSFYRLFGYIFLIIGFFYLRNNELLHIYSYLLGFLILPISTLLYMLIHKDN